VTPLVYFIAGVVCTRIARWLRVWVRSPYSFRCPHGDLHFRVNSRDAGRSIMADHVERFHS
jgi:hypothetical protein